MTAHPAPVAPASSRTIPEAAPPDPAKTDIATIALVCAFGYLDWRKSVDWRLEHPRLVQWLEVFSKLEPALERTRIPAS